MPVSSYAFGEALRACRILSDARRGANVVGQSWQAYSLECFKLFPVDFSCTISLKISKSDQNKHYSHVLLWLGSSEGEGLISEQQTLTVILE